MRVLSSILAIIIAGNAFGADFGDCSGSIQAEWLEDGRSMQLLADYTYTDGNGKAWNAPTGATVDGASIPPFLWSFIGGPFEGQYRKASVPHDVECKRQQEDWIDVHQMFYDAMRCSGVSAALARIMYGAVYHCGPRWGANQGARQFPCHEDFNKKLVRRLRRFINLYPETTTDQVAELSEEHLSGISGDGILESFDSVPPGIEVREILDGYIITVSYAPGETSISANTAQFLKKASPLINAYSAEVEVQGFADATGTNELNMAIGESRAEGIRDEILSYDLVDPGAISAISYGEERPRAIGNDPESFALNRRVEIIIREIKW